MHRHLLLVSLTTLMPLALLAAPAKAQSYGYANGTVRCESNNNRQQTCNTGWRSATLVRQLSDTRCIEGRNWGSNNGTLWVSGGCRAEFAEGRGGNWGGNWGGGNGNGNGNSQAGTIRCESNDSRQRVCNTGWRRADMVRQLSKSQCVEGRSWGSSNGNVWVSNGCRAEFAESRGGWGGGNGNWNGNGNGQSGTIRCESNNNRQQVCRTGWRNATVVRQLSDTRCVEGRNWGSNNGTLWVNGGCRAEFAEGRGGGWGGSNGGNNWNGNNYQVECASDSNRTRSCAWDRRQGRPVVVQQLSNTQCIEGRNWGYNGNSLWVSGGCRARFGSR